jgi:6-phosphogluconolactonase/glucosamine-6-phosphate isomerase/deaminase
MIKVVKVSSKEEGQKKAHDLLKKLVDERTLLALSGGTSPDYRKMIVGPNDINPGAIMVTDERYGEPFHKNSNELLLKESGVKECADGKCIEAHKILTGLSFLETEKRYEKVIAELFGRFKKKVGVMGIGEDLHTAGVFPFSAAGKSPDYVVAEVVENQFPKRISLSLKALGEFSAFIILAFGSAKQNAIKKLMDPEENDMQKYPAIFYRKSKIPTYLITDLKL